MLEVLIIGAGPTGLYAAFLAGLRKLKAAIIESAGEPGGQLTAVYQDKFIYDIPGFYKISAKAYIESQVKQLDRFKNDVPIYYGEEALHIIKHQDFFEVQTEQNVFQTKTILIAHGGGGFVPQKLRIQNHFDNIIYIVKDLEQFKDKRVAVLGGGDSAFDWANSLLGIAKNVTLVHRRDQFRALPISVEHFKARGKILTPYLVSNVVGDQLAEKLILKHAQTHEILALEVDYILVNYGFILSKSKLTEWGLKGDKGFIEVAISMETSIPGIYAAGNGVTYQGKVQLISTGQGEAATAIQSITTKLYPDRTKHFEHSTTLIKE